jgi:hypothetical protein
MNRLLTEKTEAFDRFRDFSASEVGTAVGDLWVQHFIYTIISCIHLNSNVYDDRVSISSCTVPQIFKACDYVDSIIVFTYIRCFRLLAAGHEEITHLKMTKRNHKSIRSNMLGQWISEWKDI